MFDAVWAADSRQSRWPYVSSGRPEYAHKRLADKVVRGLVCIPGLADRKNARTFSNRKTDQCFAFTFRHSSQRCEEGPSVVLPHSISLVCGGSTDLIWTNTSKIHLHSETVRDGLHADTDRENLTKPL